MKRYIVGARIYVAHIIEAATPEEAKQAFSDMDASDLLVDCEISDQYVDDITDDDDPEDAHHTFEHGNHRYAFTDDIGTVITCERELGDSELDLLYGDTIVMRRLQEIAHYTGEGMLYQTTSPSQFHFKDDQYTEDNT